MLNQCEHVGVIVQVFRGSRCVGFYPTQTIHQGDVLGLQTSGAAEPGVTFTVESMQVDRVPRTTVKPKEPCAVYVTPCPTEYARKDIEVVRLRAAKKPASSKQGELLLQAIASYLGLQQRKWSISRPFGLVPFVYYCHGFFLARGEACTVDIDDLEFGILFYDRKFGRNDWVRDRHIVPLLERVRQLRRFEGAVDRATVTNCRSELDELQHAYDVLKG